MLKVKFVDFWPGFDTKQNYFLFYLQKVTEVEVSECPDLIFFSNFGKENKNYQCPKLFFSGESIAPNFRYCDFSISFERDSYGGRNFRWPLWQLYGAINELTKPKNAQSILAQKSKFCNFIYSNKTAKKRIRFFKKLSRYKQVDSAGNVLNNIGGAVEDKLSFMRDYKFTIAFENKSCPGYVTEKIVQAFQVHSMPIYWGSPCVSKDFNSQSFVNMHEFKNMHQAINYITELDNNDELYLEKLRQTYFLNNRVPLLLQEEALLGFLRKIVSGL